MKELDPPSSSLVPMGLTPCETSSWEMEEFSDIGSVSQQHLASVALMEEMEPPSIDPLGPMQQFQELHNGLELPQENAENFNFFDKQTENRLQLPQGDVDNFEWFREETQNGVVVLGDNFEWFRNETQDYLDVLRKMLQEEEEEDRSQEGDNFELLREETENGEMLQDQHDLPLMLEEEEENRTKKQFRGRAT